MFTRSTVVLAASVLTLSVLTAGAGMAGAAAPRSTGPASRSAPAAVRALDAFFFAAALPPASFGGLVPVQEGPLSLDTVILDGGPGAGDVLSGLGFLGAYGQGYRIADPIGVLTGQPAAEGTL